MGGIKALRFIQLGAENTNTPGTAVAATTLWRGTGTLEDQLEFVMPEEDIAIMGGVDRSYIPKLGAKVTLDDVEATFEQLPYLFAGGVSNVVTGSADGVGTGKIYTYPMPTTSKNTIRTFTMEFGDDQQEEEMEYAFASSIHLSGAGGEAVKMGGEWIGRQVTPSTKTGALSVPTVEEILFSKGKLYIDAVSGTLGNTQQTNTWLGFDLAIETGWHPVWTADGQLYFSFAKSTRPAMVLQCTFEHDSFAVAEKAAWRAQTPRQIRLLFEGNSLTTGGTAYQKKTLKIDLAGKWQSFGALEDTEGNDSVTGTFVARYNSIAALFSNIVVVNQLASLP